MPITIQFNSMRDLMERNERLHCDRIFVQFEETTIRFGEYAENARRLAGALFRRGMKLQERFSVLAMNCPQILQLYGVAEASGLVIAPLNFRLAAAELAHILKDASPRVLFFETQYTATVELLRQEAKGIEHYVCIGTAPVPAWAEAYDDWLAEPEEPAAFGRPKADDLLCLMYTSGTTGRPKGAMITHQGMLAVASAWAQELEADIGDRILISMPMFHMGARSQSVALTYRAGSIILHRAFDPLTTLQAIQRERITQVHLAPTMMQSVLNVPDQEHFDVTSLKTINYAAAPMPLTVLKRAMARFGSILINGYGQTEGSGTVLAKIDHQPDGTALQRQRLASIGQPQTSSGLKIVDDQDREVSDGEIGEICLQSAQNMVGYWNNTAATVETLRGGWLHTGDLGRADEDGFVFLVDRKKDMIISGGENIYSREVEEALMAHADVVDAAVIGVPHAHWGEAVKAVVVLKVANAVQEFDLIAHCKMLIAGYKCPKSVAFVEHLPRLPSGKVSKIILREEFS